MKLQTFAFITVGVLLSAPAHAQSSNEFIKQRGEAYQLFHHGKVRQAIRALRAILPRAPSHSDALSLRRDLLEMCATGYEWECVGQTIQEMLARLKAEKSAQVKNALFPEVVLYEARLNQWIEDDTYFGTSWKWPFTDLNLGANPAALAELQVALHTHHIKNGDFRAAEQNRSSAMLALLLVDPKQTYTISKLLVSLVAAFTHAQDIASAFQLAALAEPYISKTINRESVLFANYQMLIGQLLAFTNAHSAAASALATASELYQKLDMDDDIRFQQASSASSLAAAALAVDGKLDEAKELFDRHPMRGKRQAIMSRGEFQTLAEFYFAVAEIFIDVSIKHTADLRWRPLFEREPKWKLSQTELRDVSSYRNFALAGLQLSEKNNDAADRLLKLAATQRLDNFESVLVANFESFQLPSLVDKIVLGTALVRAVNSTDEESLDLILRGSEVLGRSLRHSLVDSAVLLASQSDVHSRGTAHSYVHLMSKKWEWELREIGKLLAGKIAENKGSLINSYTQTVDTLADLKQRFEKQGALRKAKGLPNLSSLRASLRDGEAFVVHFPIYGGIGKVCVTKSGSARSAVQLDAQILPDMRVLELAIAATHPPDPVLDSQFPVEPALRVRNFLFGGLETCLRPGMHVTFVVAPELASVPLNALLNYAPNPRGDGYELRGASWLVRDFSFSRVISTRHFLATTPLAERERAPRAYLGIGDPKLDSGGQSKLATTAAFRSSLKTHNGILDFGELPDTREELQVVAQLFQDLDTELLLRDRATEELVRTRPLAEYDVIHFATHGLFKEDLAGLSESALVLTPIATSDEFDNGVLSSSEISRLSLNARLVVLSACNSARYDLSQTSRGALDLQAAFTIAGASTLLAAIWPVETQVAREITTTFFQQWRGTDVGAAEALARATRAFLDRADNVRQHPRFWAPFVVLGNGAIHGSSSSPSPPRSPSFQIVDGFHSGGEILHAVRAESDVIYSMFGEPNQEKMTGVVSRRSAEGKERWAVRSREIGSGKVAVGGNDIYVAGYTVEHNAIPLVRALDMNGRVRWKTEFHDLRGYIFGDITADRSGTVVIATPHVVAEGIAADAFVIALDINGKVRGKIPLKVDRSRIVLGNEAFIRGLNDRIVVVVNTGLHLEFRYRDKGMLGLPWSCWERAASTVYELNPKTLQVTSRQTIRDLRTNAIAALGPDLFVGGETLQKCSLHGTASIYKVTRRADPKLVWKSEDLFASSVRGLILSGDNLVAAISHERQLDLPALKAANDNDAYFNKRSGDERGAVRDVTLLRLARDGTQSRAQRISSGLNIFIQGVLEIDSSPVIYGSMGGMPALTSR